MAYNTGYTAEAVKSLRHSHRFEFNTVVCPFFPVAVWKLVNRVTECVSCISSLTWIPTILPLIQHEILHVPLVILPDSSYTIANTAASAFNFHKIPSSICFSTVSILSVISTISSLWSSSSVTSK